jgi:uncharacterized RDD family membrane protein YckC
LTEFNGPQFTPVSIPSRGPADYLAGHLDLGALVPHPLDDPGPPLVPPAGRFSALLLDLGLAVVTLGVGWLIWSLVTWRHGQTPAKQLMGHVVADAATGRPLGWGRMAHRELIVRVLLGTVLSLVTAGVYALADAFVVYSAGHRTLHDRLAGSAVRYR